MDDVLANLFTAENARDWQTFEALLHPDVEWTIVGPDPTVVVSGRRQYMDRILEAYDSAPGARFDVHRSRRNDSGLVVTELVDNVGNVSVDVLEIRDGLVRREWEFLLGNAAR